MAAVHCVIIGFGVEAFLKKRLFDYESIDSEPFERPCSSISPYLHDGPSVLVSKRSKPIFEMPKMRCGNKPSDGGNLLLENDEKTEMVKNFPGSERYIKRFVGSEEFINNKIRWCLWLQGMPPNELRPLPPIIERIEAVRKFRLKSTAAPTRKAADTPSDFFFISQPQCEYIAIPEVSSERRRYIPIGFLPPEIISSNKIYLIDNGSLSLFGILQSSMHMSWTATVGGRLKSDFQYSGSMVYNTFPWPESLGDKHKQTIEVAAQAVLDVRTQFPDSSLADLYDPLTMPTVLQKAHQALDKAVDAAYGKTSFKTEAERVAYLFELYQKYTSLLPVEKARKSKRTIKAIITNSVVI